MPSENWCSLPRDVLQLVANRLSSFADRVRLRAVCRWWKVAVPTAATAGQYVPPYLFFDDQVFCLIEKRNYYLPIMGCKFGYRPVGSYNGWFAIVDAEADFYLFNPFSGERIDLPPLWTIPDVQPVRYDYVQDKMVYRLKSEAYESQNQKPFLVDAEHLCKFLITKFVLSPNMTSVVVYHNYKKLAFGSSDSEYWTEIEVPAVFRQEGYRDVVYHDADGVFYAINRCGATISIDVMHGNVDSVVESNFRPRGLWAGPHLVSFPTGELLCLYMVFTLQKSMKVSNFVLHRLVRNTGEAARWVEVESLDGWAIFLDCFCARAQPSADAVGYKGNCIYFALSLQGVSNGKRLHSSDSGMFNIAEKRVYRIHGAQHKGSAALWIQPSSSRNIYPVP